MAVTRRSRRTTRRTTRSRKRGSSTTTRRAGAFGMYRGTSGMSTLRLAARRYRAALNPFPNTKLVRHKYVDTISIPAGGGAGLASIYQFRANSMYDPDFTGVGHQPLFRDEMATQYKYYTVLKSTIRVSFAGTNGQELNFLLWCDDDSTAPTNPNDALEQHRGSLDRLDRRYSPKVLTGFFDAAKWNKTTRSALLADDMHKTAQSGNPDSSITKFYQIYVAPLAASVTLTSLVAKVEMSFLTLWREPNDHVGS